MSICTRDLFRCPVALSDVVRSLSGDTQGRIVSVMYRRCERSLADV